MADRERTRQQVSPVAGSVDRYVNGVNYPYSDTTVLGHWERCNDTVDGTRDPHALFIRKDSLMVEPLNGQVGSYPSYRKYKGLRPEWCIGPEAEIQLMPNLPSDNALGAQAIAKGNPSRASVDLGVTIAELREAPQLLVRGAGSLLHHGADFFLSYQFGWKPLVDDVIDSFNVIDHVDQRIKEIENMRANGGIRRKVTLQSHQKESSVRSIVGHSGQGDVFGFRVQTRSFRKVWGTTRWVPTQPSIQASGLSKRAAAIQAVYGLHFDATTAWNLIPWSWMVDWFGNFGTFLEGSRNTVGSVREGAICIMKNTEHVTTYTRYSGPQQVTGGSGSCRTQFKDRTVLPFVMPEMTTPFIGPSRLSILSSLAIKRVPERLLLPLEDAIRTLGRAYHR